MTEPQRSIFILGPARSGTSLLYRLLALHPDVAYISNWNARYPKATAVAALQRATRSSRSLRRRWFQVDGNAYVYGRRRPLSERLIPAPVEGEPVFTAAGILVDGSITNPNAADALRESIESITRFSGGTHFVNKRVANNQRIDLIHQALPEARFISIVRDGRAVALSLSGVNWWKDTEVPWAGVTPTEWEEQGNDPWELCARNWLNDIEAVETGLSDVPDRLQTTVTYEGFIATPTAQLKRLAEAVDLPISESWIREVESIPFPDHNQQWKKILPADAIRTITEIQEPALHRLGYLGTDS